MTSHNFSSLCFAGGALKSLTIIGALRYLEEIKAIKDVKHVVGTSAGAVASFLYTIGFTSKDMEEFAYDIFMDEDFISFDPNDVCNILQTFGIDSGERLERLFKSALRKKMNRDDITFIELAKVTGKNLVICVTNLTQERHEMWNVDNHPNMSVIKALRISSSIPVIFSPMTVNGDIYIDGGLYNNFPIDYFENNLMKDIFGINISARNYKKTNDFLQYMTYLLYTVIEKINYRPISDIEKNIITIQFIDEDPISLEDLKLVVTKENINKYIQLGYDKTKNILESYNSCELETNKNIN